MPCECDREDNHNFVAHDYRDQIIKIDLRMKKYIYLYNEKQRKIFFYFIYFVQRDHVCGKKIPNSIIMQATVAHKICEVHNNNLSLFYGLNGLVVREKDPDNLKFNGEIYTDKLSKIKYCYSNSLQLFVFDRTLLTTIFMF